MQDWRFDDLTRTLGKATSRRAVLRGLAAGLVAGLATTVRPNREAPSAEAAPRACSSAVLQQCLTDAATKRDLALSSCQNRLGDNEGNSSGIGTNLCQLSVLNIYNFEVNACYHQQCPAGGVCVNDHCCQGSDCCEPGVLCGSSSVFGLSPQYCCAEGSSCCHGDCCAPDKTCCTQAQRGFLGFILHGGQQTYAHECADLQSDDKNCGACGNTCPDGQICQDGACVCPNDGVPCGDATNSFCCDPSEQCVVNPITLHASCAPACGPCEIYAPNDPSGPCIPKQCGQCQQCDPSSNQCVSSSDGTTCGSGLVCCQGGCVSDSCQDSQTFNYDTCQCECAPVSCPDGQHQDPNTCECVCDSGQICNGSCCDSGQECCNGQCVDACPPGQQRDQGSCDCVCSTGETCGHECCSDNKVCCPDTLSGMSCRDKDANCSGCTYTCGDICCGQYEYCCRAADYSFHCVGSSGDTC